MKNYYILVTVIILASMMVGCGKDDAKEVSDKQATYDIGLNGTVDIRLEEHSDGGYSWQWINKDECSGIDTIAFRTESTNSDPSIVGAPMNTIWTFKGLKSGVSILKFEEKRTFEPNSTIDTKTVTITVR